MKDKGIQVCGKEVLRLAEKFGKGWLALIVAEKLNYLTYIPEYIMQALAFSCNRIVTDSCLKVMGLYRIQEDEKNEEFEELHARIAELNDMNGKDFIIEYKKFLPADQLTEFVNLIEEYRSA